MSDTKSNCEKREEKDVPAEEPAESSPAEKVGHGAEADADAKEHKSKGEKHKKRSKKKKEHKDEAEEEKGAESIKRDEEKPESEVKEETDKEIPEAEKGDEKKGKENEERLDKKKDKKKHSKKDIKVESEPEKKEEHADKVEEDVQEKEEDKEDKVSDEVKKDKKKHSKKDIKVDSEPEKKEEPADKAEEGVQEKEEDKEDKLSDEAKKDKKKHSKKDIKVDSEPEKNEEHADKVEEYVQEKEEVKEDKLSDEVKKDKKKHSKKDIKVESEPEKKEESKTITEKKNDEEKKQENITEIKEEVPKRLDKKDKKSHSKKIIKVESEPEKKEGHVEEKEESENKGKEKKHPKATGEHGDKEHKKGSGSHKRGVSTGEGKKKGKKEESGKAEKDPKKPEEAKAEGDKPSEEKPEIKANEEKREAPAEQDKAEEPKPSEVKEPAPKSEEGQDDTAAEKPPEEPKKALEVKVAMPKSDGEKRASKKRSSHRSSKRNSKGALVSEEPKEAAPEKPVADVKNTLIWIIKNQDKDLTNAMLTKMEELNRVKDEIAQKSKRNYLQEKEIGELDKKIFVLIKSKMTIEEALATTGGSVSSLRAVTMQTEDPTERELYGQLFYLLQHETVYVTLLTSQILLGEVDTLLQIVMFTLYGNQYEEDEEHLLLTVFRDVLSSEVANAFQPNVMFRSNTSLTRMLTTYTRRSPGLQFVKTALEGWIIKILGDKDLDLEIFPDKVRDRWAADYRAEQGLPPLDPNVVYDGGDGSIGGIPGDIVDEIVQGIIQPRIPYIEELTVELLDSLERHLDDIPYGIRWICKQTKRLVAERWPDLPEEQNCSLVGGFFVLRYLNPAIITPAAYGIIPQDMPLPEHGRRNLTILAKVIQNLSNGVTFSTVKEAYMSVLNFILEKYQPRMIRFINSLSEVEDLDHHLDLDTYAGLTKLSARNSTIRITLNEMHFVHDLIVRHRDTVFASLPPTDRIFEVLDAMPPPPAQKLPAAENHEIELQLIPPHSRNGEDEAQLTKIAPERLLSDAKYAMFLLIHKLPRDVLLEVLEMNAGNAFGSIQAFLRHAHKWGMEQDMMARATEFAADEEGAEDEGAGEQEPEDKNGDESDKKGRSKRRSKRKSGSSSSSSSKKRSSVKRKSCVKIPRKKTSGQVVCELADRVLSILKQLSMIGTLSESNDYEEFRAELSEVVTGLAAQNERLDRDIERLCGISKNLDDKYAAAQQVAASYVTYLNNVRQRATVFSLKKKSTPAVVLTPTPKASDNSSSLSSSISPVPSPPPQLPSPVETAGEEAEKGKENEEKNEKGSDKENDEKKSGDEKESEGKSGKDGKKEKGKKKDKGKEKEKEDEEEVHKEEEKEQQQHKEEVVVEEKKEEEEHKEKEKKEDEKHKEKDKGSKKKKGHGKKDDKEKDDKKEEKKEDKKEEEGKENDGKDENNEKKVETVEIPRHEEYMQKKSIVCSHGSLSWDKIITSTNLNPKTLSKTSYEFSSESPGIYKIQVVVDKKVVGSFDLFFDELLEKQFDGCQVISNDYGEFDVSNLIFFFNKRFNNIKN